MTKTINVGIIGTGYMGKCHINAWHSVKHIFEREEDIVLHTLCDVKEKNPEKLAKIYGFGNGTHNYEDITKNPHIDIVSITTPNKYHFDMANSALENDKNVWCEKPLTTSLITTISLSNMAKKKNLVNVVGYNYIQNPMIRKMYDVINNAEIGKINSIRIEMDEDFMADKKTPFKERNTFKDGYGAIDDFGVHALSLVFPWLENMEDVYCDMSKPYKTRKDVNLNDIEVENYDKCVMIFTSSDMEIVIQLNRAAWGRKGRIALQVFGSSGSILYDQEKMNELEIYKHNESEQDGFKKILSGPQNYPYGNFIPAPGHSLGFNDLKVIECNEILNCMTGRSANLIDFQKAFEIEKYVDFALESFEMKKKVKL